jgi:hypothetical protein
MRVQGGYNIGGGFLEGTQQKGYLTGPDGTIFPDEISEYESDPGDRRSRWREW